MPDTILIDAGPLIALFDKDDHFHSKIKDFIAKNNYKFVSTLAVITEVTHMLDFNISVQIDFLEWIMNKGVLLHEIQQCDFPRIIELTEKYSDLPMDFADATLVIAAEKTGIKSIISIDTDFDVYRLPGKVRIKNVFK
jgi:predicted nucleic acid-binding protein